MLIVRNVGTQLVNRFLTELHDTLEAGKAFIAIPASAILLASSYAGSSGAVPSLAAKAPQMAATQPLCKAAVPIVALYADLFDTDQQRRLMGWPALASG